MKNPIENSQHDTNTSYYERVQPYINLYATKWKLSQFTLIDDGRESCVLRCESAIYGPAILKMRTKVKEIEHEYDTLVEYNGRHFCKPYLADVTNGILLEEQVQPGTVLRKVTSLDERLNFFCSLYQGMHIAPSNPKKYRSYLDWVIRITRYMDTRKDYSVLSEHMNQAKDICRDLFKRYPTRMLLHGDLHHDNILLNSTKTYTIIDPKGILGDPIFDLPRFILNEMEEEITKSLYDKINYIITWLSERLHLPTDILKQCFYVEMTMSECWNVEDGQAASIQNVWFAERILRNEEIGSKECIQN